MRHITQGSYLILSFGPSYDRNESIPHLALQDFDIDAELKKYTESITSPDHDEKNFINYLLRMNLVTNRLPVTFEYYQVGYDSAGDNLNK